ncbi:MAG: NAD-dependent epimerase/dehydratase family protein [Mycobacterium sp.]|nr:NAD-dependent epimerase/dehydratase family protein [Mycobacterium sp.]
MTRRVVITGASGNIGTALLRRLAESAGDYELHGISRRSPPAQDVYGVASWTQVDLADDTATAALEPAFRDADCVVHLAWGFQPTRNTRYLTAVAVGGTGAVLDAAHRAQVPHLLHMSSTGTYAAGRYGRRVSESWSTAGIPTSAYSRDKAAAEALLDDYERRHPNGMTVTRMGPGLIFHRYAAMGIRRYMFPAYLNPKWLRHLPVLPLDRSFVTTVVHADDVADAFVRAIERRSARSVQSGRRAAGTPRRHRRGARRPTRARAGEVDAPPGATQLAGAAAAHRSGLVRHGVLGAVAGHDASP